MGASGWRTSKEMIAQAGSRRAAARHGVSLVGTSTTSSGPPSPGAQRRESGHDSVMGPHKNPHIDKLLDDWRAVSC